MSSVQSAFASASGPGTKFFDILTPSYNETVIVDDFGLPIPFVVTNQVLDINTNQSADVQTFVNDGVTPSNAIALQVKLMGGVSLVKSFGPSMTDWLRNHINAVESIGSPYSGELNLVVRPFMTKVQMVDPKQISGAFGSEDVYGIRVEAPTSTEYIGGDALNKFFTAWVFKTPMTIQYSINGTAKYLSMTSQYSAN